MKANIITQEEVRIAQHQDSLLVDHFDAYVAHLEGRQTSERHRKNVKACLLRLQKECGFRRLGNLRAEPLERWMIQAEQN